MLSCGCAHFRVYPHRPPHDPTRRPSRADHSHGVSRPSDASAPASPPASCHPRTLHPQGFSPSRRLAPHRHAQPCFMLVTPLGFCSPGGFPHRQVRAARHVPDALLAFVPRILKKPRMWTRGVPTMLSGADGTFSHLQGFAPTVDPTPCIGPVRPISGRSPHELSPL